jgi:hypothetical protein
MSKPNPRPRDPSLYLVAVVPDGTEVYEPVELYRARTAGELQAAMRSFVAISCHSRAERDSLPPTPPSQRAA